MTATLHFDHHNASNKDVVNACRVQKSVSRSPMVIGVE